MAYQKVVKGR